MPYANKADKLAHDRKYRETHRAQIRANYERFRAKHGPYKVRGTWNTNWKGGRYVDVNGFVLIWSRCHPRSPRRGYVMEHMLVADKALGRPVPKTAQVHHVDKDRGNNSGGNLVICQDDAYHKLLHVRMRVKAAGGNPNTDKICCACKRVISKSEFHRDKSNGDGLRSKCKLCTNKSTLAYRKGRKQNPFVQ